MNEQEYFECPYCKSKSYNKNDIKERYCGKCHKFIGESIMPDGRPLFAWENERKILWANELAVRNKARELGELMKIFNFSVQHWQDFKNNELHFFVRADSALLKDFEVNPEKYFKIAE